MEKQPDATIRLNIKQKASITPVDLPVSLTTPEVRERLKDLLHVDPAEQVLIHKGHILRDEETLDSLHLASGDTIELIVVAKHEKSKPVGAAKEEKKFAPVHLESGGHGIFNKLGFAPAPGATAGAGAGGFNENMYRAMMEMVHLRANECR